MIELIKPLQTITLTLSGMSACFANRCTKPLLLFAALILDIAGTTLVNMYFDRDIDSKMERTKRRLTAKSEQAARASLLLGLLLVLSSFPLAWSISPLVFVAAFLGFFIDILAYTILLKRRKWWSVIIGGLAGGMPAFGGWIAGGGSLLGAFLLLLTIDAWSCAHIWALASHYREDYAKANVPMLPVVHPHFKLMSIVAISLATLFANIIKFMPLLAVLAFVYTLFMLREEFLRAFRVASAWIIVFILLLIL